MTLPTRDTAWDRSRTRLLILGGCAAFLLLLIRTAWLDDDAYITFRTVDNFLNGYGLRWNVANRVQAYTHPLWLFATTPIAALTGEVYYASILLSLLVSVATMALLLSRIATSLPAAAFVISSCLLSKAFVDYSTSGLENPLTHLLIVAFFVAGGSMASSRRRLLVLSGLAALLMLNRADTGLLVLPVLAIETWRAGLRRTWVPVLVGMLPLITWEAFSLVYYGFLVPNTAFSKLSHGVPRPEILYQGFLYLLDSIGNDPLTLLIILGAIISPLAGARNWTPPIGIALYLAYIVWVGGDFMGGRFLTAPFVTAIIHLVRQGSPQISIGWALATGLVWLTGLSAPRPTIVSNSTYGADIEPARVIASSGITDERRYYYPQSGLLTAQRGTPMPNHRWLHMGHEARARGPQVLETDAAGFIGYAAGPEVYFIDKYGLGDALMARLPAEAPWRIGHFVRAVPEGYRESIESGQNLIHDPGVRAYYERLRIITEGPLWSRERLRVIVRMNLGHYAPLIASYGLVRAHVEQLSTPRADGTAWTSDSNIRMTLRGVEVAMGEVVKARAIELSVSRNDRYTVVLMEKGSKVYETMIEQPMSGDSSLMTRTVDVPSDRSFDAVIVRPSGGDARYSLGHLRLLR